MAAYPQPKRPVSFEPETRPAKGEQMNEQSAIDSAVKRLAMALDALDAAVERRREGDRNENSLAAQVQTLGLDRARLASVLDNETARTRQLEATNREIAERLDTAIASIQSVLEGGE